MKTRLLVCLGICCMFFAFAFDASAQAFTTDVSITKGGGGSARYSITQGEGSASFVANDARIILETPTGTPRLVLSGGNMGIGTFAPVQRIHLFRSGTIGVRFRMSNSEGSADVGTNDNELKFYVGATEVGSADSAGAWSLNGTVTVQILEITGGSDLSENFQISPVAGGEVLPGMVVAMNVDQPGALRVSDSTYDRTVAGIVSGAGGLSTGMIMGQQGSVADGKYPVALTGRVYCMVDADLAPVVPGDLLTTSATPGHAMKALDYGQAQGAIIGKAMTPLTSGKGLVLVLVTLQ